MRPLQSYLVDPLRLPAPFLLLCLTLVIASLLSLLALLFLFLWVALSRAPSTTRKSSLGRSAAVVVLGDVGRSPRMCYHVQSLAEDGWRVAVLGYPGTPPPPPLRRSSVRHHHLVQPLAGTLSRLPRTGGLFALVVAPLKVLLQSASLFWELSAKVKPPPEIVIVQTPPALPTLFVVRVVCMLLGSRVIIDWHNLGYTILGMRLGSSSPLVRLAAKLERWTGRRAYAHICVTEALKAHLIRDWGVTGKVTVLHDRPPAHFRRSTVEESHRLLSELCPRLDPLISKEWFPSYEAPHSSPFTAQGDFRNDRPALIVSSTSWTVDEDFDMLLKAAALYERRARELNEQNQEQQSQQQQRQRQLSTPMPSSSSADSLDAPGPDRSPVWSGTGIESTRDRSRRVSLTMLSSPTTLVAATRLPKLLLVVTGKGELRSRYEREIAEQERNWDWVRIRTAWLERDDYPTLLGSADVGISLHTSSSGLDLPMKVVDMLGCALPVCALGFPCLDELIQHGQNGLVFYKAEELASQLETLLAKHPQRSWLATSLAGNSSNRFPQTSASGASSPIVDSYNLPPSPSAASFSLIPSPIIGKSRHSPASDGICGGVSSTINSSHANQESWSSTWKRIIRPLLAAADAEDAMKEEASLRHRRLAKGVTLAMFRRRQGPVAAGAQKRPTLDGNGRAKSSFDDGERQGRTSSDDYDGAYPDELEGDEADRGARRNDDMIVLRRSPRSYLRRRRSVKKSSLHDSPSYAFSQSANGSGDNDGIPDIHVSAPTT